MFEVTLKDNRSAARVGRLVTPHGIVETPSYVIVATDGHIRTLEPEDIPATKTQIIISNTYHLWRTIGDVGLPDFEGLHSYSGWNGPIMTDSGGFQVFSMGFRRETRVGKVDRGETDGREGENKVRITEDGVYFEENGEEIYLDAELSMKIQEQLGADIVFAFDECTSPLHDYDYNKKAVERTHRWALRSLEARTSKQILYGIVQGGPFEDLRKASAEYIGKLPFDGFGIGGSFGSSYGSEKESTFKELSWTTPFLPNEKPRHLLGIGRIEDIFRAVELGVDTFDCVIPTREARHGSLWTPEGRFDVRSGKYANDRRPVQEDCGCSFCVSENNRRRDLYELFRDKNYDAGRFATIHNIYFFNELMGEIRDSIRGGRFMDLKKRYMQK